MNDKNKTSSELQNKLTIQSTFDLTTTLTKTENATKLSVTYSNPNSIVHSLASTNCPITFAINSHGHLEKVFKTVSSIATAFTNMPANMNAPLENCLILVLNHSENHISLQDYTSVNKLKNDPTSIHCTHALYAGANVLFVESPYVTTNHSAISACFTLFLSELYKGRNLNKNCLFVLKEGSTVDPFSYQHLFATLEKEITTEVIIPRVKKEQGAAFLSFDNCDSVIKVKNELFDNYYYSTSGKFPLLNTDIIIVRSSLFQYSEIQKYFSIQNTVLTEEINPLELFTNVVGLNFHLPKLIHDNSAKVTYSPNILITEEPIQSVEETLIESNGSAVFSVFLALIFVFTFKDFGFFSSKQSFINKLFCLLDWIVRIFLSISKLLVPSIYGLIIYTIYKEADVSNSFLAPYLAAFFLLILLTGWFLGPIDLVITVLAYILAIFNFITFCVFFKGFYSLYDNYDDTNTQAIYWLTSLIFLLLFVPLILVGKYGYGILVKGTLSYLLYVPIYDLFMPFYAIDHIDSRKLLPKNANLLTFLTGSVSNEQKIRSSELKLKGALKTIIVVVNTVFSFIWLIHTEQTEERLNWIYAYSVLSVLILGFKIVFILGNLIAYNRFSNNSSHFLHEFINARDKMNVKRDKQEEIGKEMVKEPSIDEHKENPDGEKDERSETKKLKSNDRKGMIESDNELEKNKEPEQAKEETTARNLERVAHTTKPAETKEEKQERPISKNKTVRERMKEKMEKDKLQGYNVPKRNDYSEREQMVKKEEIEKESLEELPPDENVEEVNEDEVNMEI